jgi:hypothetical protein
MANPILIIGDPKYGGFSGGIKLGVSNNDLADNESPESYNYLVDDSGLTARGGQLKINSTEIRSSGMQMIFRYYDGADYHTFGKNGLRLYDIAASGNSIFVVPTVTEDGDAGNFFSDWVIAGGGNANTNDGILYYNYTYTAASSSERRIDLYKAATATSSVDMVAYGLINASSAGTITLNAVNASGLTGSVYVSSSAQSNSSDIANQTLTFWSMSSTVEINMVAWNGMYLFSDGSSSGNYYSGTTGTASLVTQLDQDGNSSTVTGTKANFKYVLIHNERLWGLSSEGVYFSEAGAGYYNRWHIDGSGNVDSLLDGFEKSDGKPLVGFVQYRDKILVFKRDKVFAILGDDADNNIATPKIGNAGAYDQKSIISCDDGFVRWFGPSGIWEYSDEYGLRQISRNIDYDLNQIALAYKSKLCMKFWKRYLVVFYPYSASGTYNNRGFIADLQRRNQLGQPCWMQIRGWNISCLDVDEENYLLGGDATSGYVWKLFYGANDNGSNIDCLYKTKYFKVMPGYECQLGKVRALVNQGNNISIIFYSDRSLNISKNLSINYPAIGTRWADETRPDLGGFILSDENSPAGSLLISEDDIGGNYYDFNQKLPGGVRFSELQVTISESGADPHQLDFIECEYYPIRQSK